MRLETDHLMSGVMRYGCRILRIIVHTLPKSEMSFLLILCIGGNHVAKMMSSCENDTVWSQKYSDKLR